MEASILDKATDWLEKELEPSNSSMDTITIPADPTTEDPFFRDAFFHPSLIPDSEPCKAVLHYHLGNTNLRVWDLIILIPNLAFLFFLFYKLPSTRLKLRATNSELFRSLYSIVLCLCLTSFSLLSPLIYGSFLHNWFAANQPSLLFAYKAQLDDGEEEPSSIINMSRDEDDLEGSHG